MRLKSSVFLLFSSIYGYQAFLFKHCSTECGVTIPSFSLFQNDGIEYCKKCICLFGRNFCSPMGDCPEDARMSLCQETCDSRDLCPDPANFGCDLTTRTCVPIDCGAPNACAEDEECVPTTRLCPDLPCPQFVCIPKEEPQVCTTSCGREVAIGEGFQDEGPNYCNVCSCQEGGLPICTLIACPDIPGEGGASCDRFQNTCATECGNLVEVGVSFRDDGSNFCNDCTCLEPGAKACTRRACDSEAEEAICGLRPNFYCTTTCDKLVAEGVTFFDDGANFCNTCTCELGNKVCTEIGCDPGAPEAQCS